MNTEILGSVLQVVLLLVLAYPLGRCKSVQGGACMDGFYGSRGEMDV